MYFLLVDSFSWNPGWAPQKEKSFTRILKIHSQCQSTGFCFRRKQNKLLNRQGN